MKLDILNETVKTLRHTLQSDENFKQTTNSPVHQIVLNTNRSVWCSSSWLRT